MRTALIAEAAPQPGIPVDVIESCQEIACKGNGCIVASCQRKQDSGKELHKTSGQPNGLFLRPKAGHDRQGAQTNGWRRMMNLIESPWFQCARRAAEATLHLADHRPGHPCWNWPLPVPTNGALLQFLIGCCRPHARRAIATNGRSGWNSRHRLNLLKAISPFRACI